MVCVVETGAKSGQCKVSNLVCLSKIHWPSSPLFVLSIYAETVATVIMGMAEELSAMSPERFTMGPTRSARPNPLWSVGRSSSHPTCNAKPSIVRPVFRKATTWYGLVDYHINSTAA